MNIGRIRIKYHSVKKEIYFFCFENGGWAEISGPYSVLKKYYEEKQGNVLLQNIGNDFFEDIIHAMDGLSRIQLDFVGTTLDWIDLKNMVEYYNSKISNVFSLGDFIELPEVQKIYDNVREYSDDVVEVFKENILKTKNVRLTQIMKKLEEDLHKKITALDKNDVNLCFVGTYSSGKSTLINAILGCAILPEAIKSETAKMFKVINSPEDIMKISFRIIKGDETYLTTLEWDNEKNTFFFTSGPKEDSIRTGIQQILNASVSNIRHEQARKILSYVNKQKDSNTIFNNNESRISGIIEIYHIIPLSEKINFTIFDTPGTDSDNTEHLDILKSALHEQTNSILVFVNWPNKEEGSGNRMLVDLLNDINNTANNSTIDMGRSLFVINGCDYLKKKQQFEDLKNSTLVLQKSKEKSNSDLELELYNKRLFFVSSLAGYVAKVKANGSATEEDEEQLQSFEYDLVKSKNAGYYKYNHLSLAQHETDAMLVDAQKKVKESEENGHLMMLYLVNSGLYSLENEIIKYGEKYALSVKAKGIIDAINRVIEELQSECSALKRAAEKTRDKLDEDIKNLRITLKGGIEKCITKEEKSGNIEEDTLISLQIDERALNKLLEEAEKKCSEMPNFKVFQREKLDEINKENCSDLTKKLLKHKEIYTSNRNEKLKEKRDNLIKEIKDTINKCKELDEETKKYISTIGEITVSPPKEFSALFDFNLVRKKYKIADIVDKGKYIENLMKEFRKQLDERKDQCKADYLDEWNNVKERIKKSFMEKIDMFSGQLDELKENKGNMEYEIEQLSNIVKELCIKEQILNDKIWGVKR